MNIRRLILKKWRERPARQVFSFSGFSLLFVESVLANISATEDFPELLNFLEAFNELYRKIVSEFFPQSTRYEYGWGVELEVYPSQDISSSDYTCEIWIAVKEK